MVHLGCKLVMWGEPPLVFRIGFAHLSPDLQGEIAVCKCRIQPKPGIGRHSPKMTTLVEAITGATRSKHACRKPQGKVAHVLNFLKPWIVLGLCQLPYDF